IPMNVSRIPAEPESKQALLHGSPTRGSFTLQPKLQPYGLQLPDISRQDPDGSTENCLVIP
ncbi:MAG: hypothetical protein O6650_08250, partial [Actinobacteria bacterium]|nr:hypothetical protein [Actinomycetota bacterium]